MHFRRLTGLTPTAYRQAYGIQDSLQSAREREPHGKRGRHPGRTARMVS